MHGLAVIIFVGQLPQALGLEINSQKPVAQLMEIAGKLPDVNWVSLGISAGCVFAILGLRSWISWIPGQLVAIVAATGAVVLFGLERSGISVVGSIPTGLPHLQIPTVGLSDLSLLLPTAFAGAALAFSDSIVTVRAFASRNHYQVDSNQELLALGMASITSGLTQGLPLSASGSRTAVAESAGSRTQVTSVVAALVVSVTLLFFSGLLRPMPKAALSGILIAAAYSLCDLSELKRMWRFRGVGFACAVITFSTLIFWDVLKGILAGVICSIVLVLRAISFPRDAAIVVGSDGSLQEFDVSSDSLPGDSILTYRLFGPLFFANCTQFRSHVECLSARLQGPDPLLIVDCSRILFVDLAACDTLIDLSAELESAGKKMALASVHPRLEKSLRRGGVSDVLKDRLTSARPESVIADRLPTTRTQSA
jgi:MFS superfamily sulfate permease-like transporter